MDNKLSLKDIAIAILVILGVISAIVGLVFASAGIDYLFERAFQGILLIIQSTGASVDKNTYWNGVRLLRTPLVVFSFLWFLWMVAVLASLGEIKGKIDKGGAT